MSRLQCTLFLMFILYLNSSIHAQGSDNVPLLAHVNDHAQAGYNDCWGYTAPDGREYALLGVFNGTAIIDITDVENAKEIVFIPSVSTTWKDIKTYQHYAYVVTDVQGNGMQIIDLSALPDTAVLALTYTGGGFQLSHNISIDESNAMLYAIGESGEVVRAISLNDPVNPVQVSTFGRNCHDMYAKDNIVYIAEASQGTIGIFDLQNPSSPVLLARIPIPSSGFVHNVWVSGDHQYMMTTEETVGKTVKYWDIGDLNNVELMSEFLAPDQLAHNAHIRGNFAYISHYRDGLRIVDLSEPGNIREVGYYDTFPGPGSAFNGAWGAFPFFDSNKVLISDMSTGLYVVKFDPHVSSVQVPPGIPDNISVSQNYPNPFNPATTIHYSLQKLTRVKLEIYNTLGQKVRTLVNGLQSPGEHQANWDSRDNSGRHMASAIYIYRFESGNFVKAQKMLLVK
ncbi:MAG: choice-of-anchor B family protein [bacterium]